MPVLLLLESPQGLESLPEKCLGFSARVEVSGERCWGRLHLTHHPSSHHFSDSGVVSGIQLKTKLLFSNESLWQSRVVVFFFFLDRKSTSLSVFQEYVFPSFVFLKIILFIFGCMGSSLLCVGFSLVGVSGGYSLVAMCRLLFSGASLYGGFSFWGLLFTGASHYGGFSLWGFSFQGLLFPGASLSGGFPFRGLLFLGASLVAEQTLQMHDGCSAQAQQLRRVGLVALQHTESSQPRDQTGVPCTGRQTPIHCSTRGVLIHLLIHSVIHSANISMALTIYQHMARGAQTDHAGTLPSKSPLSHQ